MSDSHAESGVSRASRGETLTSPSGMKVTHTEGLGSEGSDGRASDAGVNPEEGALEGTGAARAGGAGQGDGPQRPCPHQ